MGETSSILRGTRKIGIFFKGSSEIRARCVLTKSRHLFLAQCDFWDVLQIRRPDNNMLLSKKRTFLHTKNNSEQKGTRKKRLGALMITGGYLHWLPVSRLTQGLPAANSWVGHVGDRFGDELTALTTGMVGLVYMPTAMPLHGYIHTGDIFAFL